MDSTSITEVGVDLEGVNGRYEITWNNEALQMKILRKERIKIMKLVSNPLFITIWYLGIKWMDELDREVLEGFENVEEELCVATMKKGLGEPLMQFPNS